MPPAKSTPKPDAPAPKFGAAKPPKRVREPVLSREDAEALASLIDAEEWASDGVEYKEPRDAHNATTAYRAALDAHGQVPEGKTLGGRVVPKAEGGPYMVYLTWKSRRTKRETPATS